MKHKALILLLATSMLFPIKILHKVNDDSVSRLSIRRDDVIIEKVNKFTYDVYVRKKGDIESVMLVHTKPVNGEYYALRDVEYNPVNGEETRILNGEFIPKEKQLYFVVDSSPESHPTLQEAFKLRLKTRMVVGYGFNDSAYSVIINEGDSINIRTFSKPYGNYDSWYKDNLFTLEPYEEVEYDPALSLDYVDRKDNYYVLYVSFTGGDNRMRSFYYKDSFIGRNYHRLPLFWGSDLDDSAGIILNEYYDEVFGKQIRLKAYFKALPETRDIYINLFSEDGTTETPPVHYRIEGTGYPDLPLPETNTIAVVTNEVIPPPDRTPPSNTPPPVVVVQSNTNEERDEFPVIVIGDTNRTVTNTRVLTNETETNTNATPSPPKAKQGFIFNNGLIDSFQEIADFVDGELLVADAPESVPDRILDVIDKTKGGSIDIVFAIDDTGSMKDDLAQVRVKVQTIADALFSSHDEVRVGIVLYGDGRNDTRHLDVITTKSDFIYALTHEPITKGGWDIPEAVDEGIRRALWEYQFSAEKRVIVLIGDAPPHTGTMERIKNLLVEARDKHIALKLFAVAIPDVRR